MITINQLNKSFGNQKVLHNLSVSFNPLETTSIIGTSGAGKTTLFRCLLGLEQIDSGNIDLNGQKLGVVFQEYHLFNNMTILENVTYALKKVKKLSETESNELATIWLNKLGLQECLNKHPNQLSGGQKQRAALARTLVMKPQYILLDEPTSALDPETTYEFIKLIQTLQGQCGFIIITHNLSLAKVISDSVMLLDNGQIIEQASAYDFFTNPQTLQAKRLLESQLL